jgi:hypothetical protein
MLYGYVGYYANDIYTAQTPAIEDLTYEKETITINGETITGISITKLLNSNNKYSLVKIPEKIDDYNVIGVK